jgi:hypothetical protein
MHFLHVSQKTSVLEELTVCLSLLILLCSVSGSSFTVRTFMKYLEKLLGSYPEDENDKLTDSPRDSH